jgi:hypothetical protein
MIHVAPFRTEAETEALLRTKPEGDSAPISVEFNGERASGVMLVRAGAGTKRVAFSAGHADFRNGASSDNAMVQSARALRTFPQLARVSGYTMRPLAQGSSGTFVTRKAHFLFSGSAKVPGKSDYFDLKICSGDSSAYYAQPHGVNGIGHSRDLLADGGALLMHTLTAGPVNVLGVVCAVGFQKAKLVDFEQLHPHISMVSDEDETILVVPFALDRVSIGASTLLSPLVLEVTPVDAERVRVRYTVPASPLCFEDVTTSDYPLRLRDLVRHAERSFESDFARLAERPAGAEAARASGAEAARASGAEGSALEAELAATKRTVFVEDGLAPPHARWGKETALCRVGTTLRVSVPDGAPAPSPPSVACTTALAGAASGPQSGLRLYGPSETSVSSGAWHRQVTEKPSLLFMSVGGIRESEVETACFRFNGVLVVVGPRLAAELAARAAQLCAVSAPCTRLMAACAVVLYFDGDEYYVYRGACNARFYGLRAGAFAERVDFSVDAEADGPPFAFAVPQSCRAIYFDGEMTTVAAIVERMRAASVARLAALRAELACAYERIGVAFDATETRDVKRTMLAIAHENIAALLAPYAERRRALVTSAFAGADVKAALANLRGEERAARREVEFVVSDLEALVSVRVASSRNALDVQGSARKSQIEERVREAAELSDDAYAELVLSVPFYAVAETRDIAALLRAASSAAAMDRWLVEFGEGRTVPVRRALWGGPLDSETVAAVIETPAGLSHALESTVRSVAFAMRGVENDEEVVRSFLPLPIFERALAWDGGYVDWMEETNRPGDQHLRIKLRELLSQLRDFPIGAASHELSLALISLCLSLAEGLEGDDREDTAQQMLRGLVYLAFTVAASGTQPQSYVFQLAQPSARLEVPRTEGQWLLYARALGALLRLAPPAPAHTFRLNACRLVCLALRRGYIDPVTAPLRDGARASDAARALGDMAAKDAKVQWVRASFLLLRAARGSDDPVLLELAPVDDARGAAAYLLAHAPCGAKHVEKALASLELSPAASAYFATYFVRYSGCFRHAKQAVLDAHASGLANPIAALDARRAEVSAFLSVDVDVPNYAAFAEGTRAKMLGDAELERARWARGADDWCCGRAGGYEPLSIDEHLTFRGLLARAAGATPAAAGVAADPIAAEIAAARVVTISAVAARSKLPLARLCALLRVDDEAVRDVIVLYLRNWRDVNAADALAASRLSGALS